MNLTITGQQKKLLLELFDMQMVSCSTDDADDLLDMFEAVQGEWNWAELKDNPRASVNPLDEHQCTLTPASSVVLGEILEVAFKNKVFKISDAALLRPVVRKLKEDTKLRVAE